MDDRDRQLDSILVRTVERYAIFRMETDGTITSWNKGVKAVLGYSESEWVGKDTRIIFTPEDRDEGVAEKEMNQAAASGEAVDDRWHVSKDGSLRWINGVMNVLRDEDGKLLGFAKIMRDNTELREAQEALREANEMLEKRVRERTVELEAVNNELVDFTYSASHDLRSPLRGIDGFSQLVLEEYDEVLDEKGKGYLRRIREGAERIGKLLDDLLALSHVTRDSFERQPVDLSRCAKWIADHLMDERGRRNVQVHIQEGVIGEGDPESLSIVLERLLENAWKFTGDQEHALVEFGVKSSGEEEIYFVRDNGVGFDMRYADKLFKTFRSLHPPGEFGGTGVGLPIVKRIIDRHHGTVWAEGEPGKGATFYFTLESRK